jgi:hypothetical protein
MQTVIQLHDSVAIKQEIKAQRFLSNEPILLRQGQVGTIVETLGHGEAFEVEFSDGDGQAYAMLALPVEQLMVLRYEPVELLAAS